MEDNKNKTKVDLMYDDLYEQGYLEKDRDTFNQFFFAPGEQGYKNRKALYDDLHEQGYLESPTYEDFAKGIGLHPVQQGAAQAGAQPQQVGQQAVQGNGRRDMVESLDKYHEGLQVQNAPQAPAVTPTPASSPSFGGGGAASSWKNGQSIKTSGGRRQQKARQKDLYVDDKGNPALGTSEEDFRDIDRSGLYYPLMRNDSINLSGTEAFKKGWLVQPQLDKNVRFAEARAAGYKAQGERFKDLSDEQLVQAMREEEKKLDGSTSPESLQASMNVRYIETLMAAREWGLGDVPNFNATPYMVDYYQVKRQYNKNGLVDKYEKNMLTGRDDNPLLIRGWELIEDQYLKDEADGNLRDASYYRNLPFYDPKFAEEFGAYITARIKVTGERWNDAVKDAIDDFEAAAQEGRVGQRHSEGYLGSANREQVDDMLDRVNSALKKRTGELDDKFMNESWFQRLGESSLDPENPSSRYLTDPDASNLIWAGRALQDAKKIIAAFDANRLEDGLTGFFKGAGRGLVDSLGDLSTWDGGISDMLSAQRLNAAVDKFKKGKPLSASEKALLDATSLKLATAEIFKEVGRGYKAGTVTGESLPFMVEMALNPIAKSGNKIASGLAKYANKYLGKYLKKMVSKHGRSSAGRMATRILGSGLAKNAGRVTARVVGDIGAAGGMAATSGLGHSAASAIGYHTGDVQYQQGAGGKTHFSGVTGGDDWVTSTLKGFGSTTIENASEMWGEYFKPITNFLGSVSGKALEKMHLGAITRWLNDVNSTEMARLMSDFRKQTRWDGNIAEYFEEVAGNIANALTVGDMNFSLHDKDGNISLHERNSVFNVDDNLDTFLGVSLMSGAMGSANIVGYRTPKYRAKQDVKRYGDMARGIFGARGNDWSTIESLIQDNSEDGRKQFVADLMQSGKYSQREKQAALQYAGAVYKSMGMDLGESKQKRSAGEQEAEEAYGRGYDMANLETIAETSSAYNQLRSQMEREYGTELMERMDSEPGLVYGWVRAGAVSEEDAKKVLDYLNAKMAYEGAVDRLNDDDSAAKAAAEAHVDDTIHTEENGGDGQIHPVTLKGREGDHYVVSGNVVTDNDGNVDVGASDNEIVVVDSNGKRKMTTAKDIAQVGDTIDPNAAKAQAVASIESVSAQVSGGLDTGANQVEGDETLDDTDLDSDEVAAPDGATQQDVSSIQAPLPVTEYNQDDLVTVEVDGQQVDGIVTNGLDDNGNVTLYLEEPINGRQNVQLTPEQLNQVAVSYTSRDGETISRGETPQEPQQPQPQQQQTPTQESAPVESGEVTQTPTAPAQEQAPVSGESEEPLQQPAANGELDVQAEETPQTPNAPVAEAPQQAPAQPSLPVGEDGNADFSNATPQEAHDYIYNDPELDEDEANEVVRSYAAGVQTRLDEAQAALKQAEAVPAPKMENYRSGNTPDVAGYKRAKRERNEAIAQAQATVDAAQREVDLWNGVQAQHMMARAADMAEQRGQSGESAPAPSAPAPVSGESENNAPTPSQATPAQGQQTTESTQEPSAEPSIDAAIVEAGKETNTEPTDAQKEAGNYKKGHVKIDGFDISIEQPKGSVRSGVDASGKEWSQKMNNTYGYIRGTEGVDGDHIDVFLSDDLDGWNGTVYVVDQVNNDGSFDEHKVMYGFNSEDDARQAYLSNYEDGWQGLGSITAVSKDEFKKWIGSSHRKTKPFAEYKNVKVEGEQAAEEELTPDERIERARMEALENRAEELADSCGLPVQVARSLDDLSDRHRREVEKQHAEGKYVNGFYDPMTKQIVLFLPDIAKNGGMRRLERTFLHEGVAHGGLRALFENAQNGIQTFDELCDQVWEMMPVVAQAQMMNYIGVQKPEDMTQEKKRIAADEYMAHLAEWGVDPSVKTRIITAIKNALRKIGVKMKLSNNDIVSLLAASRRHLNEMDKARDSLEDHGIATSDSGDALMFAVSDILEGDERKKAIKELMDVTGRSEATVKKWLKAEESLAKVILDNDNVELLDLQVDESVPSIWNNSDYPQGTVEFSNICRKRLPFTVIYQRLQEEFPNTVFDASTLEDIRNTMKENGVDVACGLCFVEDRRQLLGEIGEGFIKMVEGEEADLNENQQKALDKLRESGDNYVPNLYELLTLDGMKKLRKEHPAVAKAFVEFNNARGMQAGRLFQAYSAYHREILNWNKAKVKKVNDAGGLRIFSFSDFEAHHLIDLVQVLTDCAAKGVKVQGYTKVPEFAKAVKETKMKLNRSLIAKGKGYVDADYVPKEGEAVSPNVIDGKRLLLDTVEGINVNHPDFFDSTDNNNVGNILVGINDEQIRLAMADSFVDYIIPFHSGLSEAIRAKKGIGDWVNYKLSQLEKKRNDKGKLVNADKHGVNIYTDVLPRGEELIGKPIRNARDFQNAFFKACEEKGWVPRFSKFINKNKKGQYVYTPGYEKLLLDFKLFDKNGKLLPQEAVVPLFDNEFNKKILDDYVKGEKAKTPYDDLYEKIKERLGLPNGTVIKSQEDEDSGVLFSSTPAEISEEEREVLMGIHNITAEKLRSAIGLGGLANPSMAVVDTTKGLLNNFGEISLIPGRDLIDKKTGKNAGTFTADAYTPRFPTVHRRLGKGGEKKLSQWIKSLGMRSEMEYNTQEQFNDWVNGFDIQANALVYPFLHEKGLSTAVDQEDHNKVSAPFREIVGRYHGDINALMDAFDTNEEVRQEITDIIIDDIVKQEAQREEGESWKEYRDRRRKWRQLVNEAYLDFAGFVDRGIARATLEKECSRYVEASRFNPEATRQAASIYIDKNGMRSEYTQWREQRFAELGVEEQMYAGSDSQGRSKYKPITLESVSKAMKKQGLAGGESSFFSQGPGGVRARLTPRLTSLNQIRAERGRIQSGIDTILKDYSEELDSTISNLFGGDREAAADVLTSADMKAKAKELGYEIGDGTVRYIEGFKQRVMELPTEYFETKFERPVMLNEFEAAVVPNDVDSDIREALEAEGLDVREYDPELAGDRERVTIKAAQDSGKVLFSTSDVNEAMPRNTEQEREVDGVPAYEANNLRFSVLDPERDADLIAELDGQEYVTVYRTMAKVNGEYYPPMDSRDHDNPEKLRSPEKLGQYTQSEERPDLAFPEEYIDKKTGEKKTRWKFNLRKSNGKSVDGVAYNPYMHTSDTALNDQFSEAQDRDDLVVVECRVPVSELDPSSYHAEKALDPVGWKPWKAGPIVSKMTGKRNLLLSRWVKPVKELSWSEVADMVSKQLGDQFDVLPSNTFSKGLRAELEKRGYQFIETDNKGIIKEGLYKGVTWSDRYYDIHPELDNRSNKKQKRAKVAEVKGRNAEAVRFSTGWHGSGSEFDQFDHSHMGEGEGAQAYGWGTYITSVEGIGRSYATESAKKNPTYYWKGQQIDRASINPLSMAYDVVEREGTIKKAISLVDRFLDNPDAHENWAEVKEILKQSKKSDFTKKPARYLYEVEIPDNNGENYISWNETLPKKHRRRIAAVVRDLSDDLLQRGTHGPNWLRGGFEQLANTIEREQYAGKEITERLRDALGNSRAVSEIFSKAGFVGTEYPAQYLSGGRKDGAKNYVIYNEDDIEIKDRIRFSTSAAVDALRDDERVYNDLLGKVFSGVSNETRRGIVEDAMRNRGNDFGAATEAWLGGLADDGKFADVDRRDWGRVKLALHQALMDNGVDVSEPLSDGESRYVLWKAGQIEDGVFSMAEDVVMRDRLLNGARAPQYTDSADVRFSTSESEEDGIQFSVTPRDRAIARDQYERWMKSGRMQWLESMQDSMLGLKKLMQAIMGNAWTKIEDVAMYENPYTAENLMSSVTAAQQQAFYTEFMKPLLEEVGKLCKGGKKAREKAREELTNYLMAKHGLERNQVLADRDAQETAQAGGDYQDAYAENRERDYSGLTALTGEDDVHAAEAKAQQMVDDYEAQHDTTALWSRINAATQVTLEKQYKSGMLSYAEYQRISGMFDYYVPLRGWEETTSDEVYGYLTSKAGPFLGGGIVKRAGGRTSKADDPIATIAQMGDDSIRTGNRNLMKQTFLNFVQNHPSDAVSVSDLWLQYDAVTDEWVPVFADIDPNDSADVVEQKIQDFEQRMQELVEQEPDKYKHGREAANIPYRVVPGMEKEHQVLVKRNGQTWVLTINGNPRAAQALNGLTNPDVPMEGAWASAIRGAEWVNRTLSALYTTLSPAFIVSNFLRDSGYSNTMVWVRESPNYALRFNANYLKLNPATLRFLLGRWENGTLDENKPLQKHFKEFMLNGGETGFAMVKDLDKYKKDLLNEVKNMNSRNFVRKGMKIVGSQYELLGRSIENCARFAAYVTSREMGRDVKRSAYDAKEISVNFNKKGSGGKSLGKVGQTMSGNVGAFISGMARSLYTFWNAGVQGMTNAGRAVKRHPVKAALMGAAPLYAAGFLAPILAQMMGAGGDGDDDKNAYYNLPEYVRRSNLCIWLGDAWLTIPLPIEFRSIYGMGELTYGVISGNERYSDDELAMQIVGQFSQLLPIDMLEGGGGFHPFIPTLFKPIVEAEQNKSWSGLPIYRSSEWNKDEPEYTKAFSNANEWIVSGAEWLNAKTGGDEFKKGWIDLNPAKIEYMLKGYLGGIYTTIDEVRRAAETALGERDFEWRNIPLANRVIKQGDERTESKKLRDEYFNYKEDYEETKRLINKYKNAEDTDLFDYAKKLDLLNNSKEYGRYLIFEKYSTMLEAYQKAKKGASGETLKKIEEDEKVLMRQLVNEMHAFEDGKLTVGDRPKLSKKDRSEDYGYMYNNLRTYVDINEDALLDSSLKRAKASGNKGMAAALSSIKRSIGEMKKGLGRGNDDKVMDSIRRMREGVLRSFGLLDGGEVEPDVPETEEPQEEWGDEGQDNVSEPEDDEFESFE